MRFRALRMKADFEKIGAVEMRTIHLPPHDRDRLNATLLMAEKNLRALELFSGYLNLCPRFVTQADVEMLCRECGVFNETAYSLLMGAACGLDAERDGWAREMQERYFRPAVHCMDAQVCRADPYYAAIRMPDVTQGAWTLGYKRFEPYEAFASDDLRLMPDGREIPQIGYFTEPFLTPVVLENGREWMTVTPSEINTMTADIQAVSGKVAVFGLGLGYYAFMAARKPQVAQVTVIERDENVIALFEKHLLPQFPNREKIRLVRADAYEYAAHMAKEQYVYAYVDIWHDVLDGVEMYLKMKRLEHLSPGTAFLYWIETSMLAWLRGMALMEIAEDEDGPMMRTLGGITSFDSLMAAISQEGLRRLAPRIPLEIAKR